MFFLVISPETRSITEFAQRNSFFRQTPLAGWVKKSQIRNRLNGNNILDSSPCGLRVDWSYVRVFSWFALQMNHENQTTKSHEPGITKRHKGSADESSMLLPLKRSGSRADLSCRFRVI